MIALGLALSLVAAGSIVFVVIAAATASSTIELSALGVTISVLPVNLFIAGALTVFLLGLGLRLISRGTRRSARTHKELRSLRKDKALATQQAAEREDAATDDSPANADASTSASAQTEESTEAAADTSNSKIPADLADTSEEAPPGRHSDPEHTVPNQERPNQE